MRQIEWVHKFLAHDENIPAGPFAVRIVLSQVTAFVLLRTAQSMIEKTLPS